MKVLLGYAPEAYWYQPYMAPYLLKGYLSSALPDDEFYARDINIEYLNWLWSSEFAESQLDYLNVFGDSSDVLLAELQKELRPSAWERLRDVRTYKDWGITHRNATLLRESVLLANRIDTMRGVDDRLLPTSVGCWKEIIEKHENSLLAAFFHSALVSGDYQGYDVFAFTISYAEQLRPTLLLCKILKEKFPEAKTVVGGGIVTHFLDSLLKDPSFWEYVDFTIPYEGEHSFAELLASLKTGQALPKLNIAYRVGPNTLYEKRLDLRPNVEAYPDFSDLKPLYPTPRTVFPLLTSKGCYWGKCKFCTHHEGYGQGYSRFDDATFEQKLLNNIESGASYFYLVDEALPPRKLGDLANLFSGLKRKSPNLDLGWMAEARLDKGFVRPTSAKLLRDSSCKLLVSGIESGNQRIIDLMQKGIDLSGCEKFAKDCWENGIRIAWMFFVGYPGETEDEAEDTFRFIAKNKSYVDFATVGAFSLEKDSPLWQAPGENSISDIYDVERPYFAGYRFKISSSSTIADPEPLRERLSSLKEKYHEELNQVFGGAVDRTLAMFFPEKIACSSRINEPEKSISPVQFYSHRFKAWMKFDPGEREFQLDAGEHSSQEQKIYAQV